MDVSDPSNPKIMNKWRIGGGEDVKIFKN